MKKIKILFWKILQWYNEVAIKMSENDLKLFERRSLFIEKHLKNLGVDDNYDLDNFTKINNASIYGRFGDDEDV